MELKDWFAAGLMAVGIWCMISLTVDAKRTMAAVRDEIDRRADEEDDEDEHGPFKNDE